MLEYYIFPHLHDIMLAQTKIFPEWAIVKVKKYKRNLWRVYLQKNNNNKKKHFENFSILCAFNMQLSIRNEVFFCQCFAIVCPQCYSFG